MTTRELSEWLRCPNCLRDLLVTDAAGRALGCEAGHRFDVNRHGYVTLLPPKRSRFIPDSPAMLDARAALLGSGAYAPIAETLAALARETAAGSFADLGCGTGYYARAVSAALGTPSALLADLSPEAVRRAARAVPAASGVVLDIWSPLPLRDGCAELLLNVFAPRNPSEFARLLAPGGTLLVVVPQRNHLIELRASGHAIDVPAGKAERLTEGLSGFALRQRHEVVYPLGLDEVAAQALIDMGPSAHHRGAGLALPERVTVAVDVLHFTRVG